MRERIIVLRRLALGSTLITYLLIFLGGLVRVSGAGLGCPDWPKCFGRWIPPLSAAQVPAEFNAATFNLTLAWIEFVNRLAGMITGLFILVTAVWAIMHFRRQPRIVLPATAAAVLVAVQGWYGSIVVSSHLQSITVSVHLVLALIIVGLLIYLTQRAYILEYEAENFTRSEPSGMRRFVLFLWLFAFIQILLGTQVRTAIEELLQDYPLLFGTEIIRNIGSINYIHSVFGLLVAFLTFVLMLLLWRKQDRNISPFARMMGLGLMALVVIQILIGSGMEIFGVPEIMQVFHLWIAALFFGGILALHTDLANPYILSERKAE